MITQLKQIYLDHGKPDAEHGDCDRTAVACLLGLSSPEEVPHWFSRDMGDEQCWEERRNWLAKNHGLVSIDVTNGDWAKGLGYHLMYGPSPRLEGVLHMIVGYAGIPFHDPHPDGGNLAGDPSEWIIQLLVPMDYAED